MVKIKGSKSLTCLSVLGPGLVLFALGDVLGPSAERCVDLIFISLPTTGCEYMDTYIIG